MRHWLRTVKSRFGITAPHVAVRTEIAWYWRALGVIAVFVLGYALAYWQFVGRLEPIAIPGGMQEDVHGLQARVVQLSSQLQVANAAQSNLAKEMAIMQDEGMRLKEDVAFYKSILAEGGTSGVPKIHSVKVSKGVRSGDFQYQILLVQSGRHDKVVQGSVQLILNGTQAGKPMAQHVESSGPQKGLKVNFKYYQRMDGTFSVPPESDIHNLQVQYVALGAKAPALTQTVSLPD